MSNTFGTLFRLTSFGESHGPALGGVIDGCPAGVELDFEAIDRQMARRRPGQNALTTPRKEADKVIYLSGLLDGVTTGTPIGFYIENTNARSADYDGYSAAFRPNHADYTYFVKYHGYNDMRGGGRSSARETVSRVVAGAIALQVLNRMLPHLRITAYTQSVGNVNVDTDYRQLDFSRIDENAIRCPDPETARRMEDVIMEAKAAGDTVGGVIRCVVSGYPAGVGQPVFNKISAQLASAMMSINAAKGFQIGLGFDGSRLTGSQVMDRWTDGDPGCTILHAESNNSGGIQGGISNGQDIYFDIAFKPVATLMRNIETIDRHGNHVTLKPRGRHDACVLPRAVPIVESMAALVLLDQLMLNRATDI